jgi:hypothetical protein
MKLLVWPMADCEHLTLFNLFVSREDKKKAVRLLQIASCYSIT